MKVDKVEYELEMVSGDGMARVMALAKGAAANGKIGGKKQFYLGEVTDNAGHIAALREECAMKKIAEVRQRRDAILGNAKGFLTGGKSEKEELESSVEKGKTEKTAEIEKHTKKAAELLKDGTGASLTVQ